MTNTKDIVCLSFPDTQPKSSWVSKVYCYGNRKLQKPMKKTHALADLNMIGRRLFDSELMENIF